MSVIQQILSSVGSISLEAAAIAAAVRNNASLWYVPSNLAGVYQDSAATTPVTATTQLIGCITDKGVGGSSTTSSGTLRPALVQLGNGKYAMSFSGAQGMVDSKLLTQTSPHFIIACGASSVAVASGSTATVAAGSSSDQFRRVMCLDFVGSGQVRTIDVDDAAATNPEIDSATSTYAVNVPLIVSAVSSGSGSTATSLFISGQSVGTGPAAGTTTLGSFKGEIGSFQAMQYWNGPISLVCKGPVQISLTDRRIIEAFAASLSGAAFS